MNIASAVNIEKLALSDVNFVQEKTGDTETKLKDQIKVILAGFNNVKSAYLVLVEYSSTKTYSVALCVELFETGHEKDIVSAVSKKFSSIFGSSEHLDVIFINQKQKDEVNKVAKPFYTKN